MKRTRDENHHERADWEWRERHSHVAHEAPRVVAAPAADAELWEEARRRRAARRAENNQKRRAVVLKNAVLLSATGAVSLVLWFYTAKSYVAYQDFDAQVQIKRTQLRALEDQREAARARVSLLSSDKGRAQLLVERGYLRPGERILLFPARPDEMEKQRAARIPVNDLTPQPPALPPTRWQKLRDSLGGWLR
jgi:cell division protein FtsB